MFEFSAEDITSDYGFLRRLVNTFTIDTDEYYLMCYKVNDMKTFKYLCRPILFYAFCAHKSSHILYLYYRLTRLTGAFKIILIYVVYYGISLEGYQIIYVRSFSFGPTSFRKYKQVNIYTSSGSTAPPKRTSADITQKLPKTLTFIFITIRQKQLFS